MHDEEGESVEAEEILVIIETETVVYRNSTEYRVLEVSRANNVSTTEPNTVPGKDTIVLYVHMYICTYVCTYINLIVYISKYCYILYI